MFGLGIKFILASELQHQLRGQTNKPSFQNHFQAGELLTKQHHPPLPGRAFADQQLAEFLLLSGTQ